MDPCRSAAAFATTHWDLVRAAAADSSGTSRAALEKVCAVWWPPLYAFARRTGHRPEDARDLTQGFFAHLLASDSLARADPQRGRFRSYLLGAFRHFLSDAAARAAARKRGGDRECISLDAELAESRYGIEPTTDVTPDRAFDRAWALAVLDRALGRLREESVLAGRADLFDGLKTCLTGDLDGEGYRAAAARLRITEGAAKMTVTRLRQRFRALVRQELASTVRTTSELEDELREFVDILRG